MALEEYRKKIANLSVNEQKLRDLYLRDLALGKVQGPPTGYVSLDKPWLKYYSEEAIMSDFTPMSIYELMRLSNIDNMDGIAINYFGKKISYKKMMKKIDEVAKGLLELGIKKGDIIMMSLPNIPESEYLFYALNKIGAIVNSIDPRTSKEIIEKDILDSKSKFFFGIDVMCPKLKDIENLTVIPISPYESLPLGIKQLASLTSKKQDLSSLNVISWRDFCKKGKISSKQVNPVFENDKTAVIVHTGGSTGVPKGVELTNENFNALIYQLKNHNINFKRGSKFLNILPPFIALGLDNAMHLAACLGVESIMIPSFEPEDIPKLVLKHKPNLFLCGPIHCLEMINSNLLSDKDLSFLELVVAGGDKMPKDLQEKFQFFLKSHNSKANAWIGYGATETSAGNACNNDDCFKIESVGIPYLKNNASIFDLETNEEVCGYNKIGELRISGPTLMHSYFPNSINELNDAIKEDENGIRWYASGDLAHFDEDGNLYIDGRIKRIITRRGFKIYPNHVEQLILEHPDIAQCAVVGIPDEDEINIPVANIVLESKYIGDSLKEQEIIDFVNDTIEKKLPEYSMMAGINFHEELPLTPIGKLDFKKLESIGIKGNKNKVKQKRYDIK